MLCSPIAYDAVLNAVIPVKKIAATRMALFRALEKKNGFSLLDGGKSTQITLRASLSSRLRFSSSGDSDGVRGMADLGGKSPYRHPGGRGGRVVVGVRDVDAEPVASSLANAAGGGFEDEMVSSESREGMTGERGRVIGVRCRSRCRGTGSSIYSGRFWFRPVSAGDYAGAAQRSDE